MPLPPSGCPGMSMGCEPAPPSQEAESPVVLGEESQPALIVFLSRQ